MKRNMKEEVRKAIIAMDKQSKESRENTIKNALRASANGQLSGKEGDEFVRLISDHYGVSL